MTPDQADLLRATRRAEGFVPPVRPAPGDLGTFCIARLTPGPGSQLVAFGFTADVADWLAHIRAAAPAAVLVRCWPCERGWSAAAVACLAGVGCRPISGGVFGCGDVDALIAGGGAFFQLLPAPGAGRSPAARWS